MKKERVVRKLILMGMFFCGIAHAGIDPQEVNWEVYKIPKGSITMQAAREPKDTQGKISELYSKELGDTDNPVKECVLFESERPQSSVYATLFYNDTDKAAYVHLSCHGTQWIRTYLSMDDRFEKEGLSPRIWRALGGTSPIHILSLNWIEKALKAAETPSWAQALLESPDDVKWNRVLSKHQTPQKTTLYVIWDEWTYDGDASQSLLKPWHFVNDRERFQRDISSLLPKDYKQAQKYRARNGIKRIFFPEKTRAERKELDKERTDTLQKIGRETADAVFK